MLRPGLFWETWLLTIKHKTLCNNQLNFQVQNRYFLWTLINDILGTSPSASSGKSKKNFDVTAEAKKIKYMLHIICKVRVQVRLYYDVKPKFHIWWCQFKGDIIYRPGYANWDLNSCQFCRTVTERDYRKKP